MKWQIFLWESKETFLCISTSTLLQYCKSLRTQYEYLAIKTKGLSINDVTHICIFLDPNFLSYPYLRPWRRSSKDIFHCVSMCPYHANSFFNHFWSSSLNWFIKKTTSISNTIKLILSLCLTKLVLNSVIVHYFFNIVIIQTESKIILSFEGYFSFIGLSLWFDCSRMVVR